MKTASAIIVQLIHIHGPLKGTIQEFNKNEILIGRHSTCDVIFPGKAVTISRKHATIRREGNRFQIIDNSANGLFVNGKRTKEAYLRDGDVLIFSQGGPKVSFLTRIDENAEVPDETQQPALDNNSQEREHLIAPKTDVSSYIQQQPMNQTADVPIQSLNNNAMHQDKPAVQNYQTNTEPSPMSDNPVIEQTNVPLIVQFGAMLQSFKMLPITIGKSENSDFILDHPLVEDKHMQIFFWNRFYHIKDLTGRNRVLINNTPINSSLKLNPEDKITLVKNGPIFQFMEGGRLAEVFEEPSPSVKTELETDKEDIKTDKPEKPREKGSFLKSLFKK